MSSEGFALPNLAAIETVFRSGLLTGPAGRLPTGSAVVKVLEDAISLAADEPGLMTLTKDYGDKFENWAGLREEISGRLLYRLRSSSENATVVHSDFKRIEGALRSAAENKLVQRGLIDIADNFSSDTTIVLLDSYFDPKSVSSLGAILLKCYNAGGWPCGWHGKYPDGNIIVYWPHDQEPQFEPAPTKNA